MGDPDHQHYGAAALIAILPALLALGAWALVVAELGWNAVY